MKAKIFAILRWLKTNLIIVISLTLCLASLGGLYWVWGLGNDFVAKVNTRLNEADAIERLQTVSVFGASGQGER